MFDAFGKLESLRNLIEGTNQEDPAIEMQPLDPEHFTAFVKNPSEISEDTLVMLADLVDGKLDIEPKDQNVTSYAAPPTLDRIMNSLAVIYICEDDIPVGVITLVDPTVKNYQGIKPVDTYSMYADYVLDGRAQQEFFAVADEYTNTMVPYELCSQMRKELDDIQVFCVVDDFDKETIKYLMMNAYEYIATLDIGINENPVQLWINHTLDEINTQPASQQTAQENELV